MQISNPPITTICFCARRRFYDWSLLERRNAVLLTLLNFPLAETPAARGEIRITRWRRWEKVLKALFSDVFFLIKARFWFALRSEDVFWESAAISFIAICVYYVCLSFSIRTEHHSVSRVADLEDREMRRAIPTLDSPRALHQSHCAALHFQTFRRDKFVLSFSLHLLPPPLVFNSNAFVVYISAFCRTSACDHCKNKII